MSFADPSLPEIVTLRKLLSTLDEAERSSRLEEIGGAYLRLIGWCVGHDGEVTGEERRVSQVAGEIVS